MPVVATASSPEAGPAALKRKREENLDAPAPQLDAAAAAKKQPQNVNSFDAAGEEWRRNLR